MDNRILKYLEDILGSIQEIEMFLEERPRKFSTFCTDTLFRRGVERNIEIMGEAMNKILKLIPDIPISNARKVVDTRNYVIHSYDTLKPDILWSIVINHLPLLKDEITTILKNEG